LANTPAAEDFLLRIAAVLVPVLGLGTPLVRWIAGYLRDARVRELKAWLKTEDGKDCMETAFQEAIEGDKRYLYDYLNEWFNARLKQEREGRANERSRKVD
jgi:hypothetical protein